MIDCKNRTKKTCLNCPYKDYCDRANVCNGECHKCDITDCENNPKYKEKNK